MKGTMEAHPVWPVLLLATSNCSYALCSFVHVGVWLNHEQRNARVMNNFGAVMERDQTLLLRQDYRVV